MKLKRGASGFWAFMHRSKLVQGRMPFWRVVVEAKLDRGMRKWPRKFDTAITAVFVWAYTIEEAEGLAALALQDEGLQAITADAKKCPPSAAPKRAPTAVSRTDLRFLPRLEGETGAEGPSGATPGLDRIKRAPESLNHERELEAAGALATAGLAAGAIEGRDPHGGAHDGKCANCGAEIVGPFCAQCGQASHPHRSLVHVVEEFLHGILHFDTKAWRTLPMVIFRPGTLTRNYVHGKRARYISPLALFLFTIFFMFFVFAFMPHETEEHAASPQREATAEQLEDARESLAEARADLAELRAEAAADRPNAFESNLTQSTVSLLEREVARLEAELAAQDAVATEAASEAPPVATEASQEAEGETPAPAPTNERAPAPAEGESGFNIVIDEPITVNADGTWQDRARDIARSEDFVVVDGWDSLNEKIRRKFENPDLALYKIQQAAYKFSFLLAPLSLPFIALLFLWKRGLTLYDHVVYALYALSFASLLFVGVVLSTQHPWTSWLPGWLIMVGLPVHTFFHLKGAYALGWWSALWRTFFMLIFATIIASIFLILIIVLGLAN